MTKQDIDNIIQALCPNDEDFEKPIISPAYLKKELEAIAVEQNRIDKPGMMCEIYMAGVNMTGEYQGCWVRFRDIERIVDEFIGDEK